MITVTRDLPLISLSGNPMVIEVNTDNDWDGYAPRDFYTLFLDLYIYVNDAYVFLHTFSIQVDEDGNGSFDISSIVNRQMSPSVLWPLDVSHLSGKDAAAVVRLAYKISEGYGIPFVTQEPEIDNTDYYAIPGGFSDSLLEEIENLDSDQLTYIETEKMFLTNIPTGKRVALNQPECVRWLNSSEAAATVKVIVKEYAFTDDSTTVTQITTLSLEALSLYSFNVTPGIAFTPAADTYKWEIYLTNSSDVVISEVLEYRFPDLPVTNERFFIFQNSLGGFDTARAVSSFIGEAENEAPAAYLPIKTTLRNSLTPVQDRYASINVVKGSFGYLTNNELAWLIELLHSEQKYMVSGSSLLPATRRTSSMPYVSDQPPATVEIEFVVGVADMFYTKAR
jgi:hypothetical protein